LLGLQTITRRVATVISRAIASRSWQPVASRGTLIARAPLMAARWGYIENEGQAYTSSASGSSMASAAARRISQDPLPTATRPTGTSQRSAIRRRRSVLSGSG
jgi:hypothetical protein